MCVAPTETVLIVAEDTQKSIMAATSEESEVGLLVVGGESMETIKNVLWDPNLSKDWDNEKPTTQCLNRIKRWVGCNCLPYIEILLFSAGCSSC